VRVDSDAELLEALSSSEADGPVLVFGGGSNLVVADEGFDGLAIHVGMRGIEELHTGRLRVRAGESWESVVDHAVERGWAGVECLAGIPGCAGATPIQNVGAYGQEVSQVIAAVEAVDLRRGESVRLEPEACAFAYRDSRFKRERDQWIVTAVEFDLRPGGEPTIAYGELRRVLDGQGADVRRVRDTVLELRRRKSMVVDANDPNSRSVGSFFTNPIVDEDLAHRVVEHAVQRGIVETPDDVPRYDAGDGRIKFPAAWLIERAGIAKGTRRGGVGVSSKHTLALVHLGGGTTRALLDLGREIRDRVDDEFGVRLVPEPRLVGTEF
jgi:UDP-N-acetylmuramate dehydrogenase